MIESRMIIAGTSTEELIEAEKAMTDYKDAMSDLESRYANERNEIQNSLKNVPFFKKFKATNDSIWDVQLRDIRKEMIKREKGWEL